MNIVRVVIRFISNSKDMAHLKVLEWQPLFPRNDLLQYVHSGYFLVCQSGIVSASTDSDKPARSYPHYPAQWDRIFPTPQPLP